MGTWRCLLAFVVILVQNDLAYAKVPLLCSLNACKINPTQNTITLEKPYCFYTATSSATVALYVVKNSAVNMAIISTNNYYSTAGGTAAPYVAGTFANPNCADNPTIADVNKYVYRVGSDESCFNTPYCNGPLANNTAYRFMYVFFDASNPSLDQSEWSAPITTKQGKLSASIDTWPGGRSGGMIVLTSILSVLTFLVLAGLVAAVITYLMTPTKDLEPTRHESRSAHHAPQKPEGGPEYATTVGIPERYATNPQA
ncbi:uroplakin-3a [Rhinoderma darwinii]|uniref:uroplakin-3a n=1 Tax=Rhinoderma darwinii TaxID=43563 RepID=UPI003F6810F2